MKKLLYITVNSKPEDLSASKTVGRKFVNIQSSGANINWISKKFLNKGLNYVEDMMKALGVKRFEELLVDGTGYTEEEKEEAIEKALNKIDDVITDVWKGIYLY